MPLLSGEISSKAAGAEEAHKGEAGADTAPPRMDSPCRKRRRENVSSEKVKSSWKRTARPPLADDSTRFFAVLNNAGLVRTMIRHVILSLYTVDGISVMPMHRLRWIQSFSLALSIIGCFTHLGYSQAAAAEKNQPATFKTLAESATAARGAGKADDAINAYQQALALRADWEEGWWYLGTLQYDADQLKEAVPAFQKVVELDPAQNQAWSFLGLCEFGAGEYPNAMEHLQKGQGGRSSDDPELSRVAQYHLALLLNRNGEFVKTWEILAKSFAEQASSQIKVALGLALLHIPLVPQEMDPSEDALIGAAGETAAILVQGDQDKTLASFRNLLRDYSEVPYLHYAYGGALAS